MQAADPDATPTDDRVSLSLKTFVIPFKFVIPEFVRPVKEVVPFKIFAIDVKVAYKEAAVALVIYEDSAEDNA